jgi:hypothetical protein
MTFKPYDGIESCEDFIKRFEKYKIQYEKKNYDIVLKFMQNFLAGYDIKIKSLLDLEKISEEKINKKEKYNKKFFKNNCDQICEALNINKENNEINTDDIEEHELIELIKIILKKIGYKFIKYKDNSENFYKILCE